ncbi:hypothetical protein [Hyphomicrobium sp.]|uniref:hypothetical protein n=1 Tax=Hyphomicrobium sp. TaxID=82 RepID=UPI002FDCE90F
MTTIDAAAAWRGNKSVVFAVCAALMGFGLGGCETGSNLFASNSDESSISIAGQPPATAANAARIAVAPVIGAPDTVAKQLESQVASAIEAQRIAIAKDPNAKAEYTLRGYIVSAREQGRTKVSYIWDVTDPSGKRVNRITGEEVLTGTQSKDPWASVTPQVIGTISNKTAGSLAAWLPSQNPAAVAGSSSAQGGNQAQVIGGTPPSTAGYTQTAATAPATGPATTGSIARPGAVSAMVPSVVGAPGDGSVALTNAIQRELSRSGVALTTTPSGQTYKVEGKVAVGPGQNGKQPIQIDWDVKDPQGKKLGTVSQKNEIPQGSLDGAWGKTADAAASAAAQGIVKLLPKVN